MNPHLNLMDLIDRKIPPDPWSEGEKIPWHDPDFSARMLHEHLSQDHNAASRRVGIIDQHVHWIHSEILSTKPTKILDLGCGPGLYTSRLAKLGHTCTGIDYAPASIGFARQQGEKENLACRYIEEDVRKAPFGEGYGLVMMVHGEINVFRPEEARAILEKAHQALLDGGHLVLEVHTLDAVQAIGEMKSSWSAVKSGLFSDQPHLLLKEAFWDSGMRVAMERYYLIDATSASVTRHAASTQGYGTQEYERLLKSCGFIEIKTQPSLGGVKGEKDKNYIVFVAKARRTG